MKLSLVFLTASFRAALHAIIPDIYCTSSSDTIHWITEKLKENGCKDKDVKS